MSIFLIFVSLLVYFRELRAGSSRLIVMRHLSDTSMLHHVQYRYVHHGRLIPYTLLMYGVDCVCVCVCLCVCIYVCVNALIHRITNCECNF